MSRVNANPIVRVEVVMADGRRLVVTGAMDGYINTINETADTGDSPGGFITRELTGRTTVTVTVHAERLRGDTLEWSA